MIHERRIRAYHRDLAELRRLAESGFDRARHHEAQRLMLLARERQRLDTSRVAVLPGTTRRIIVATAKATGVTVDDIFGCRRAHFVWQARWVAAWLCRKHTHHSYCEVGRRLGGKDHSSIINACRGVQADLDSGGAVFGPIIAHVERELGVA